MKLKIFVQDINTPTNEFGEKINNFIKEIENKGGKFKDIDFVVGDWGITLIMLYEEKG